MTERSVSSGIDSFLSCIALSVSHPLDSSPKGRATGESVDLQLTEQSYLLHKQVGPAIQIHSCETRCTILAAVNPVRKAHALKLQLDFFDLLRTYPACQWLSPLGELAKPTGFA